MWRRCARHTSLLHREYCVHLLVSYVEVGPDFIDVSVLWASLPQEPLQFKCPWGTIVLIRIYFDCCICIFLPSIAAS